MTRRNSSALDAQPSAVNMLESLRGLGYSPTTALADILDNSVAAGAAHIELRFVWDDERQAVAILDDGHGMSANELYNAMRIGCVNPWTERAPEDLGRFGLGLKTASLSQCRSLTVASKRQNGTTSSLRWDLDELMADKDSGWFVLKEPGHEAGRFLPMLEKSPHGTLVVWEKLDRIVTPGFSQQDYLDLIDSVEKHLSLTFHRFLQGNAPRLHMTINGRPVKGTDPFLQGHPATWNSPVSKFRTPQGVVTMQGHVLPHKDRLSSREYLETGGPKGWIAHEGFYVYRNERLLVPGSWLNLGSGGHLWRKDDTCCLARIRLDICNTADVEWKLDILKSTAEPPVTIRKRLVQFAEMVRKRAKRAFGYRGAAVRGQTSAGSSEPVWTVENVPGNVRYHISRTHPAVAALLAPGDKNAGMVEAVLSLIETNVPVQRLWMDSSEGNNSPGSNAGSATPSRETGVLLSVVYRQMKLSGIHPADAKRQLKHMDPFDNFPEFVDKLSDSE